MYTRQCRPYASITQNSHDTDVFRQERQLEPLIHKHLWQILGHSSGLCFFSYCTKISKHTYLQYTYIRCKYTYSTQIQESLYSKKLAQPLDAKKLYSELQRCFLFQRRCLDGFLILFLILMKYNDFLFQKCLTESVLPVLLLHMPNNADKYHKHFFASQFMAY